MICNSMNVYPVGCSSKYAQGALGHTVSMSTWSMSLCCTATDRGPIASLGQGPLYLDARGPLPAGHATLPFPLPKIFLMVKFFGLEE